MGLIGLQVRTYQLLLGALDITKYLTNFGVSIPISEYNAPYQWSGTFEVTYNLDAARDGLTPSDFDETVSPNRWRDGKTVLQLSIDGVNFYPLYIKNYQWSEEDNRGSGDLVQLIDLMNFDRESEEIPETTFNEGTKLQKVVNNLLLIAGRIDNNQIITQSQISIPSSIAGSLCVPLVTRNPLEECLKYIGGNGQFLIQNVSGVLTTAIKNTNQSPLFQRSLKEVSPLRREKEINFSANKYIVIGSKNVPKKTESSKVDKLTDEFGKNGKPKYLRTFTYDTYGELFPDQFPGNETVLISGAKTIFYRYNNDRNILFFEGDYLNLTPEVIQDIYSYPNDLSILKDSGDDVLQTITIQEEIVGKIFQPLATRTEVSQIPLNLPKRFLNDFTQPPIPGQDFNNIRRNGQVFQQHLSFIVSSITIETEKYRKTYVPKGRKYPDLKEYKNNYALRFPLVLDNYENLITPLPNRFDIKLAVVDPVTGLATVLEARPELEEQQSKPLFEYDTETYKAVLEVSPNGWNTFLPKTYKEEFEYLESEQKAFELAQKIAYREWGRSEGRYYICPIPSEWVNAGFPLFPVCDIHNSRFVVENPTIVIERSDNGSQMYFKFFGEKLATIEPVPDPPKQLPFIPNGGLQIVPNSIYGIVQ